MLPFAPQNAQESAEALEAVTLDLQRGNERSDAEAAELRAQAAAIEAAIAAQQERARALRVRISCTAKSLCTGEQLSSAWTPQHLSKFVRLVGGGHGELCMPASWTAPG